jgi:hypothetical protein
MSGVTVSAVSFGDTGIGDRSIQAILTYKHFYPGAPEEIGVGGKTLWRTWGRQRMAGLRPPGRRVKLGPAMRCLPQMPGVQLRDAHDSAVDGGADYPGVS